MLIMKHNSVALRFSSENSLYDYMLSFIITKWGEVTLGMSFSLPGRFIFSGSCNDYVTGFQIISNLIFFDHIGSCDSGRCYLSTIDYFRLRWI